MWHPFGTHSNRLLPRADVCRSCGAELAITLIIPCDCCTMQQTRCRFLRDLLGLLNRGPYTGTSNVVMAMAAVLDDQHESTRNKMLYSEFEELPSVFCGTGRQNFCWHKSVGNLTLGFGHNLREIRDGGELRQQRLQQGQPVSAKLLVFNHYHYFIEKRVHCGANA